jgi:hypothetical protein
VNFPILLVSLLLALPAGIAATTPPPAPPTKAAALTLADLYLKALVPKLQFKQKSGIEKTVLILKNQQATPATQGHSIEELVNHGTVALAQSDGIEAVIVLAAHLVKFAPANPRTVNLFGVALHAIGREKDALLMLDYARILNPKSELILLNAATVCQAMNQDATAKLYIDKVLTQNPKNIAAWTALASYWMKKGQTQKALEAMIKAAALGGGVVQRKAAQAQKVADDARPTGADSPESLEMKLARMKTLRPNTTADLIEDQFPLQAQQIRAHCLRLVDHEKMIMPPLPQINVSSYLGWLGQGQPYIDEWQQAFAPHAEAGMREVVQLQTGITDGDSDREKERKGLIAANKEMEKGFADAERSLKMMENMPGMPKGQLAQAKSEMQRAKTQARADLQRRMAQAGITSLSAGPAPRVPAVITSDADAQKIGAELVIPGFDYGSPFAISNYRTYVSMRNGYEMYFLKYYRRHMADVTDIFKVYDEKVAAETERHDRATKDIDRREEMARKAVENDVPDREGSIDYGQAAFNLERQKEELRFHKNINTLTDAYFAQWQLVTYAHYQTKMKPMLDQYWATCALYIRNMNQPDVMKAEYCRVKRTFWQYGGMAVGLMNRDKMEYYLDTEAEQRQLDADIAAGKAAAAEKAEDYAKQTKAADDAVKQWLEDNLALGIAGEFLALKITPRQITVEEYVMGLNFKHVLDFKTGEWTTYRSMAAKIDVGIQVGPIKAGISARADILESYDTYNLNNGQLTDCGAGFAKGSASANLGAGPVGVNRGVDVTLDPAAQRALSVEFTKSMSLKGNLSDNMDIGVDVP